MVKDMLTIIATMVIAWVVLCLGVVFIGKLV